jgi:putative FmdB family regulatory protein
VPLYEYQCRKCGHRFEKIQKFSDPEVKKCPQCGGRVERLLSAPAVQFKGSGWYVTDYARKGTGKSEGKADAAGDGAGPGKSESTPADKSDKSEAKPKHESKKPTKK